MDKIQEVYFNDTPSSQTFRSKGEAVEFKHHAMNAYRDRGGKAPLILDFGVRWRDMAASCSCRFSARKLPPVPLDRRLDGSGGGGGKENNAISGSRAPVVKPLAGHFTD
jgi:hypothetical protein